jgi:uncharacterized repeat protein (TIGR03803 family)
MISLAPHRSSSLPCPGHPQRPSASHTVRRSSPSPGRLLTWRSIAWLGLFLALPALGQFDNRQLDFFCLPNELGANAFARLTAGPNQLLYGTTFAGAGTVRGTLFRLNTDGTDLLLLHRFTGKDGDGADPYAGFILGSDGLLYGTTAAGGSADLGTIFRLDPVGGTLQILHSFSTIDHDGTQPYASLIEATDGALYGTTQLGGTSAQGVVFTLRKDGSGYTLLHHFTGMQGDGSQPSAELIEGLDGALYGTTHFGGHTNRGTVFKLDKHGANFTVLHSFAGANHDGAHPFAGLIQGDDGRLFGTTTQGGIANDGAIFTLDPNGQAFRLLHSFGHESNDARRPFATLFRASDGLLYGTTAFGGNADVGTIFRINPNGDHFQVLYSFTDSVNDGSLPYSALIETSDGTLSGTTWGGGASAHGTIFRLNRDGQDHRILHSLALGADAIAPHGTLLEASDGSLYGTTWTGGDHDQGTIFKINRDATSRSIQHSCNSAKGDGTQLHGGLIEGTDRTLYGTAVLGGSSAQGAVFAIQKDGSGYRLLRSFTGSGGDGSFPYAALLEASDGSLYGTTALGGTQSRGTLFRMNKDGNSYSVLHRFAAPPADGTTPYAPLIEGTDGRLYGTTARGGTANQGTVFRLNRNGSGYQILRSFTAADGDGALPYAGLTEGSNGDLYGMTQLGGQHNLGTLYQLRQNPTGYSVLHQFTGAPADGSLPGAGAQLVVGSDNALYGTTHGGGTHDQGTVFRIDLDGTGYRIIHSFNATDATGANPYAGLTLASDGALYGSTQNGGVGCGTLFRIAPAATLAIERDGTLRLSGPAGFRYAVQYLDHPDVPGQWLTLTHVILATDPPAIIDPTSGATTQRSYRGVLVP